jgi:tRNA threonylcarbamoyladenosine biosynthesis protein TsaE
MKYYFSLRTFCKLETIKLGTLVANCLKQGDIILLTGDLGAGKTTFTQGVADGLGINERVISPTFNILKCYFNNNLNLYHIDAYRLEENKNDIGLEEFIEGDGVCLIEWPKYISHLIPSETISIKISNLGDDNRLFEFESDSEIYEDIFKMLGENYD